VSFYNTIHGMNAQFAVLVSPFLPVIADNFPRFRDIFSVAEDAPQSGGDIFVYTRMGAGNAECWKDSGLYDSKEDKDGVCECPACRASRIEDLPCFLFSYEDEFDSTYKTFVFTVSDEHRKDFDNVFNYLEAKPFEFSPWYKQRILKQFKDRKEILKFIRRMVIPKIEVQSSSIPK
jgi:hypothetical protein